MHRAQREDALFVGSLEKGLRVLNAFLTGEPDLGLSDICRLASLDKSAAQRFAHTLMVLGYLEKDPRTRRYRPSTRMLDWSVAYMRSDPLIQVAGPHLVELHEQTRQAVNLSRLVDTDVSYVVRIPARRARLLSPIVGERVPAFCTASGRAILSGRPDDEVAAILDRSDMLPFTERTICDRGEILARIAAARRVGYTIAEEECLPGELTIAAPILNAEGRSIGGVNMSMTTRDWTPKRMRIELAPALLRTVTILSSLQGYRPSSAVPA
ncbi:IclR family transcriptional regulator [Dongia deserti]|uniref:IclR family transcriptional regulator n=1 Tax=Dongia deserti TaxID=2268030 RepID=UPI0013C4B16F|nr:IclR family transcriptional regulator C-terminal domain-containing protein [Dongia deserti]